MSVSQLETAAEALGELLNVVVFLGGASIHVWISDPVAPEMRATADVDVICEVASMPDYHRFEKTLRELGFEQRIDDTVICRWYLKDRPLALDFMPTNSEILGFSNEWYEHAISTARDHRLPSGRVIRIAGPAELVATKLEAWANRGSGDILLSDDVHDVLTLINGRPELLDELLAAAPELREFVALSLRGLKSHEYFTYAVQSATAGYGPTSAGRAELLAGRIDEIIAAVI